MRLLIIANMSKPAVRPALDELVPILQEKYPAVKIIVSSGYPEEHARQGFPPGAVAGFLQKPYTLTALAQKIGEALDGVVDPEPRAF